MLTDYACTPYQNMQLKLIITDMMILKWNNSTKFIFTIQIILNVWITLRNGNPKNLACNMKQWCNAVATRTPKLIDWVPYKLSYNKDSLVFKAHKFFFEHKIFHLHAPYYWSGLSNYSNFGGKSRRCTFLMDDAQLTVIYWDIQMQLISRNDINLSVA